MSRIFSIIVYDSNGLIAQAEHCDETCYRGKGDRCDCICRQINHKKGKSQAIWNTREYSQIWFQDWIDENGTSFPNGYYAVMMFQLPLPGLENMKTTPVW